MHPNERPQATHAATIQPFAGRVTVNLLRLPAVKARTGLEKSTIYAAMAAKTFPTPVRLSSRAVAWREDEIDLWIAERVKVNAR